MNFMIFQLLLKNLKKKDKIWLIKLKSNVQMVDHTQNVHWDIAKMCIAVHCIAFEALN